MPKKNIVILTGAGISAESGLKTFRDSDGLWMGHNVTDVATPEAFYRNPDLVQQFYNERRKDVKAVQPNAAHFYLAKLEEEFNVHIVTQNIDDLHERAGSRQVLHLHGQITKMHTVKNTNIYFDATDEILTGHLGEDGSQLRPHVVWFGEEVPMLQQAAELMTRADIFILVGSSLQVYPAAGLIEFVPHEVPKFILDKKIPSLFQYENILPIEKSATEGIKELDLLLEEYRT